MNGSTTRLEYRPLHAPHENGSVLVEPPLDQAGGMIDDNLARRSAWSYDVQGRPLEHVARQARRELLREARRWTSSYRDVAPPACGETDRVLLAGHQPQLFHPGVWFKNFALDWLARRHRAVAVNLVVDSDTMKTSALRVPCGSAAEPHVVPIPLDRAGPAVPYEERRILDRAMFAEAGRRAAAAIGGLVPDPLIGQLWPLAVERARKTDNLGACLAQSRHVLESAWGLNTLEVPQSRVCQSESFAWLVAHLLAQLPRFRRVYNETVAEYRRVNGIRSAAHPVPDLDADGPWLEAPFWIWTASDPRRRALYAAQQGDEVRIGDRQDLEFRLPLTPEGQGTAAVGRLLELSGRGVKIRSRALVTTLWARLALGDLFLHGIGGGKYDQVTDALIARFFGLEPPGFMVLSATLHLPIERGRPTVPDERTIDRRLRELAFHPEQFLDGAAEADGLGDAGPLLAEKRRWIATPQTVENAHERWMALRRINEALGPWVAAERERLAGLRQRSRESAKREKILGWREYAFCLYPEQPLREFLSGLLQPSGTA
jgi:hypothetical protein